MNLSKTDLTEAGAKGAGISKAAAAKALNAMLEAMTSALKKGGKVTLPGFVSIKVAMRKARAGVNPRTGAKLKIPAKKVVRFRAGKTLAEKVR